MNNTRGTIENSNALKYNHCMFHIVLKSIFLFPEGLVGPYLSHKT